MGWPGPWRAAVQHGLDFLESHYRRADRLYRTRASTEQTAVDDSANLYDQAFVLLALATAARAEPELASVFSLRAGELVQRLREVFGVAGGGFRAGEGEVVYEADPLMHLFEASQAWLDVEDTPAWRSLAADLAGHALERMIDRPFSLIRETFDADWRPVSGRAGRLIEPGHQFEWAWLLERWGRRSGDAQACATAQALYAAGRRGVEPDTGLVLDELLDDFTPTGVTCRLWPQAERLRAALSLEADSSSRIKAALSAAAAMEGYFTKDPVGLWRDSRPDRPGPAEEAAMASTLYHLVGAIAALSQHVRSSEGPSLPNMAVTSTG
jgi:mannose/cellobiose epimerase-like protein (N-acyl-D-glucosamine 2-epimerase family)